MGTRAESDGGERVRKVASERIRTAWGELSSDAVLANDETCKLVRQDKRAITSRASTLELK